MSSRSRYLRFQSLLLFALVASAAQALPQLSAEMPAARATPRPAGQVRLTLSAEPREADLFEAGAREIVERLPVTLHTARSPALDLKALSNPTRRFMAEVWVDLTQAHGARLYLYARDQDRLLVREVERELGSEELSREALWQILQAALEGVLAGTVVGVPRKEALPLLGVPAPEQPKTKPELPAPPHPPTWWEVGLGYQLQGWAAQELRHGPIIHLGFQSRAGSSGGYLGAQVMGHYFVPTVVSQNWVNLHLYAAGARGLLSYQAALAPRWDWRIAAGAGCEWVVSEPRASSVLNATFDSNRTQAFPLLSLLLGVRLQIHPRWALSAELASDLSLFDGSYTFLRQTGELTVFKPFRFRPGLILGLSFS